jgi:NAD(P)H-dependent FMN reductase
MPAGAQGFRNRLASANAFVIVSPEYNASRPGALKNAIDWASRARPQPFDERHAPPLSASPSMAGGNPGIVGAAGSSEHLGARVYPDMFSLAQAHNAFADDGCLARRAAADPVRQHHRRALGFGRGIHALPVVKRAWVEFLGERPDPVIDRVDG